MLELKKPLDYCVITQPFGVNYVDFYQKNFNPPMKGHNGVDFRAGKNNLYACFAGQVIFAGEYSDGGIGIEMVSNVNDKKRYKIIYYHLDSVLVKAGDVVQSGDKIGISDNTGLMTTGSHLHLGLKECGISSPYSTLNYNNGYRGCIDLMPFLESGWKKLPVDNRYGKEKNWYAEWLLRFKNAWVHRRLIKKYARRPLSLRSDEVNAIIYGSWGFDEALNPAMRHIWALVTKAEWNRTKQVPFQI